MVGETERSTGNDRARRGQVDGQNSSPLTHHLAPARFQQWRLILMALLRLTTCTLVMRRRIGTTPYRIGCAPCEPVWPKGGVWVEAVAPTHTHVT